MALFFPIYGLPDLPSTKSVMVGDLIPGDSLAGLRVPVYARAECPEPTSIALSAYLPAYVGTPYVVPTYSARTFMPSPFSRPVSAITASAGP